MRLIDAEELGKKIEEEFDGICAYDVSPDEADLKCTATDKDFEEYEQGNGITPCSDYGDCQYCPYCEVYDESEDNDNVKVQR